MIIWLASYPKSGNTWLRSLLSAYFFSQNGKFNFKLLKNINQFSSKDISLKSETHLSYQKKISQNWIKAQKIINQDKKIHFLKTHNAFCKINDSQFTDRFNTKAVIYIVRDPRNLITSLSNHYEFGIEEAFKFLTNKRKVIFPGTNTIPTENEPEDFNFIGDWSDHYKSWKNINFCPVKIIRYEDFLADAQNVFLSILNFLSAFMDIKFDENKIQNAITSTSFKNLSEMENNEGFDESIISKKNKKKIRFFNLGKKNNWKKILNHTTVKKINITFQKEMKELDYL